MNGRAFGPSTLTAAHKRSIYHRDEIERSARAGCFYCLAAYPAEAIVDWTDDDKPKRSWTALCPRCGIDSVIGDASGYPIDDAFLRAMNARWF